MARYKIKRYDPPTTPEPELPESPLGAPLPPDRESPRRTRKTEVVNVMSPAAEPEMTLRAGKKRAPRKTGLPSLPPAVMAAPTVPAVEPPAPAISTAPVINTAPVISTAPASEELSHQPAALRLPAPWQPGEERLVTEIPEGELPRAEKDRAFLREVWGNDLLMQQGPGAQRLMLWHSARGPHPHARVNRDHLYVDLERAWVQREQIREVLERGGLVVLLAQQLIYPHTPEIQRQAILTWLARNTTSVS